MIHGSVHPEPAWEPGSREAALVNAAIECAVVQHGRQTDKGGFPYVLHPLRVMTQVAAWGYPAEYAVAAALHDTVEDTSYTLAAARGHFGAQVAEILGYLTKKPGIPYDEFITRIIASGDDGVLAIKVADIQDNLWGWRLDGLDLETRSRLQNKYLPARSRLLKALDGRGPRML